MKLSKKFSVIALTGIIISTFGVNAFGATATGSDYKTKTFFGSNMVPFYVGLSSNITVTYNQPSPIHNNSVSKIEASGNILKNPYYSFGISGSKAALYHKGSAISSTNTLYRCYGSHFVPTNAYWGCTYYSPNKYTEYKQGKGRAEVTAYDSGNGWIMSSNYFYSNSF
ncbi:MAG: hypothetical protein ACRCTZ_02305 [Sarcina sp.]